MKVLHVIASMDPRGGGVCQAVRTMIEGLQINGVQSEVVSFDDPSSSFVTNGNFTTHALGSSKGPWGYNKNFQPWLRNNATKFAAIIIHGLWLYPSYATERVVREIRRNTVGPTTRRKIPQLLVMPHGMLDPYFQKAEGRKLKAIRNWLYWKLIESRVVNHADRILFTAIEEQRLAATTFKPYHPKKQSVVGLGVQDASTSSLYDVGNDSSDNGENYLLFLSRIHPKKGVDLLVKAYEEILEEDTRSASAKTGMPKLVIAGPGIDTDYGTTILGMVNRSPLLQSNISFPGMLEGMEKWSAFQNCEAFILPSHQENFGIAIVEALACSKPVLITNRINIWQEIEQADAGLVAEPTVKDIKKMMLRWIALSRIEKDTMRVQARDLYLRSFSVTQAAARLLRELNIVAEVEV